MAEPSEPATPAPERPTARRRLREIATIALAAIVIALLIKTFLVQVFWIPSASMVPTLERGDRILVCRICTRIGGVERGDLIVFGDPTDDAGGLSGWWRGLVQGLGISSPEHPDFVKRVIGLPGDVIEIRGGTVFVDGAPLDEPYLDPAVDDRPFGPIEVPPDMLFVLGDNRLRSGDSRFPPPQGVGLVPEDEVIGQVVLRLWPPSRVGGLG